MDSLFVAFTTVAVAEMGDRTQLLSLLLAAQFRKPWPIIAGIFVATLANHAFAGAIGVWLGGLLNPTILNAIVGVGMIAMAGWALIPDKMDGAEKFSSHGAFVATVIAFFIAEMGDKTQVATVALAAGYSNLTAIVIGSTAGLMAANVPAVFLGDAFATRLPLRAIRYGAAALFFALGLFFLGKAVWS